MKGERFTDIRLIFLRIQTLLCHADGTVEKPKVDDEGKPYINGGGERKCKNWELLYNAATDSDDTPFFTDDLR